VIFRSTRVSLLCALVLGGAVLAGPAVGADDPLSSAAEVNDLSVSELRTILATDDTARLDRAQQLYYAEPSYAADASESAAVAGAAPYALSQTLSLHSNPSAKRTIFLDFDGHYVSGTDWNAQKGLPAATYAGYSLDSSAAFNDTELANIQSIWQRVSEDYAAFDIDVTTEEPAAARLVRSDNRDQEYGTRALITSSTAAANTICRAACGGVAYVGVFDEVGVSAQPAWIFAPNLSNSTKAIAEAASHEVGHNLGLHHDGITEGSTKNEYYAPNGLWAPIMGAGYNAPVTQWSRGEYVGSTNQEDDLAVMASFGAPPVVDDVPDTVALAATSSASSLAGTHTIGTAADVDVFRLPACSQVLSVVASPAPVSPNLDLRVDLLDAYGNAVTSVDPAASRASSDVATGLDAIASSSTPVAYARVDGVGTTSYTDYASIGRYTLAATCGATPVTTPPAPDATTPVTGADDPTPTTAGTPATTTYSPVRLPRSVARVHARSGAKGGARTARIRWAAPTASRSTVSGYQVVAYRVRGGQLVGRTVVATLGADASAYTFKSRKGGAYRFAVVALSASGAGDPSAPTKVVQVR
jgi:hypothetical protein